MYRRAGRPLPRSVDGPWDWPPHRRLTRLRPRTGRALTIAPAWGITAAPGRPGALGRPGPWAEEAADIERAHGPDRTAHVSLEEFARTLTSHDEELERFREGGVPARQLRGRVAASIAAGDLERYRAAFRQFRGFDRPNLLHLFATFRFDAAFAHEYPEAVQVGPLWPGVYRPLVGSDRPGRPWVWYASPASAEAIAPELLEGLGRVPLAPRLAVRTSRPWASGPELRGAELHPSSAAVADWRRQFRQAGLRIVTGSRSLLEALELGGPFLYFNGVLGRAGGYRRHRPEKIAELLRLARAQGWPADLRRDLDDFSRGRRVAEVVERAAGGAGGWRRFPHRPVPTGFAPGFEDAGRALVRFAREFAAGAEGSDVLVERTRSRSRP